MPGADNTIILKKPGRQELISPGIVSVMDASGFDTVTARFIEQTTASAVTLKYKPGVSGGDLDCPVKGGTMVLMGATDTADLPGNCCEYTLTWRGLLTTLPERDTKISKTRSVRERIFDSITGIPNSGGAVRGRILELQAGLSIRKIYTKTEPEPPSLDSALQSPDGKTNPGRGYTVIGATPTYCYPHGWICYSWQSEEPIPGIWFVSAEYKFEQEKTSG